MAGIPPEHVLTMTAGDALKFAFQLADKNKDHPEDPPTPRNLTGWEALSQVRQTRSSDVVLCTWAIDELGEDGIISMKLLGSQTQQFGALKSVVSDVQLTDPDGDPVTVLRIVINASQDVTRE